MSLNSRRRSLFFPFMSIGFLAVALVGFSTTFFLPVFRGTFRAPIIIYVHGALLFTWLLLFIAQAQFIRTRRIPLHRQCGWLGAVLAVAIVGSGIAVGFHATTRDLAAGAGDEARGQFVNIIIEMLLFGTLVAAAVVLRRDRESHKRLLLLATISILGPAWFRFRHFLPGLQNPLITLSLVADSLLLIAIAYDLLVHRRVHPVYLWVGGTMIAIHMAELFASESALWLLVSRAILGVAG
jgi:hypothetical protein